MEVQSLLTISAKVVRAQDDMFAAHFLDLTDEERENIYQFLVYESRRENPND